MFSMRQRTRRESGSSSSRARRTTDRQRSEGPPRAALRFGLRVSPEHERCCRCGDDPKRDAHRHQPRMAAFRLVGRRLRDRQGELVSVRGSGRTAGIGVGEKLPELKREGGRQQAVHREPGRFASSREPPRRTLPGPARAPRQGPRKDLARSRQARGRRPRPACPWRSTSRARKEQEQPPRPRFCRPLRCRSSSPERSRAPGAKRDWCGQLPLPRCAVDCFAGSKRAEREQHDRDQQRHQLAVAREP
jgi:hypothetical protein